MSFKRKVLVARHFTLQFKVYDYLLLVRQHFCSQVYQWQFGAAAVLSAWLMLALLVRKLPIFGIYVIMVGDIIRSFAKAFLIFTIFLVGFAIFFYMTLGSQVRTDKYTPFNLLL